MRNALALGIDAVNTFGEKYLLAGSLNPHPDRTVSLSRFLCICFQPRYAFIATINFSRLLIFVEMNYMHIQNVYKD